MSILLSNCDTVGSGAFGKVYVGEYEGKKYAAKRRYITHDPKFPSGCVQVNEIDAMCRLKHPRLLHAVTMQQNNPIPDGFRYDKNMPNGESSDIKFRADLVYILSEAMQGDLGDLCLGDEYKVTSKNKHIIKDVLWQILDGIAYIHSEGLIHRDIKPHNILYNKSNGQFDIRICDFDMIIPCLGMNSKNAGFEAPKAMTPEFTPPEVLEQDDDVFYTQKVDIWGVGMTIHQLITGEPIFRRGNKSGTSLDMYILSIQKKYFPNGDIIGIDPIDIGDKSVSFDLGDEDINDLIQHMLDCDPKKRYTAKECMKHPFFGEKSIPSYKLSLDHKMDRHFISETMAKVFDEQLYRNDADVLLPREIYGFFLGLDILMRVCSKKRRGDEVSLAKCCYNLGMKYYFKESARCIPVDSDTVKRKEYTIISSYLGGKIYRDFIYNHIQKPEHAKSIYKYIMAQKIYPCQFSSLLHAIESILIKSKS